MSVSPPEQHDHHHDHCESYCYLDDCYCCYCYKVSAHYANGGPHSFNSPVTVSPADLHTYQLGRTGSGGSNSQQMTSGGVMMASPNMTGHMPGEGQEVSKKREMRLLKNRLVTCFHFGFDSIFPSSIIKSLFHCICLSIICIILLPVHHMCRSHYPLLSLKPLTILFSLLFP